MYFIYVCTYIYNIFAELCLVFWSPGVFFGPFGMGEVEPLQAANSLRYNSTASHSSRIQSWAGSGLGSHGENKRGCMITHIYIYLHIGKHKENIRKLCVCNWIKNDIYIYIYICVFHLHIKICIYIYIHMYLYIYTCIHIYIYTHIFLVFHVCMYLCIYALIYVSIYIAIYCASYLDN